MRFRDIEFRYSQVNKKHELVRWYRAEVDGCEEREYCYTIAFFDETKDGYNLRTIGSRFFEDKDAFIVGKHAIEFLNAMFYELQKEKELE
jgi:hypothetical protein